MLIKNSKILTENIKEGNDKYENVNSKVIEQNVNIELTDLGSLENNKLSTGVSLGEFHRNKIKEIEEDLKSSYPQYPNLLGYANPTEIKIY